MEAWNRRDGAGFAGLFTAEADYVTGDGEWLSGRAAIEALVRGAEPGAAAAIEGAPSVKLAGDHGSAVLRWSTGTGSGAARGVTTCVLARGSAGWLIERLQNTDSPARA